MLSHKKHIALVLIGLSLTACGGSATVENISTQVNTPNEVDRTTASNEASEHSQPSQDIERTRSKVGDSEGELQLVPTTIRPVPTSVVMSGKTNDTANSPKIYTDVVIPTPTSLTPTPTPMPAHSPEADNVASAIMETDMIQADLGNPCISLSDFNRTKCEEMIRRESEQFSAGVNNSAFYVRSYDSTNIPQFANANFTELDKFSRMSKLRSAVGHDYAFNTSEYDSTGANCKSMKHYLVPVGVPRENHLYHTTPHAFEWMSIKFFAPADGIIEEVRYIPTAYGIESHFSIRAIEYPGYYFNFYHIALDPRLVEGSEVKSGELIGTLGSEESWGEIAVEVRVDSRTIHLISFLQVATEQVLEIYRARGLMTISDVVITKEQRDSMPKACESTTDARFFEGSGRGTAKTDEGFMIWQFESSDNWFFFDEMD